MLVLNEEDLKQEEPVCEEQEEEIQEDGQSEPKMKRNNPENFHQKKKNRVDKMRMEIDALKALNKDLENEMLKDRAELENFKKRQKEEQIKDRIYANQALISALLTPLEYLDKACSFESDNEVVKNFLLGFKMIDGQLFQVLEDQGLKEIPCKEGDSFDPKYHHALEKEHQEDVEAGLILAVLSKGYQFKDRIIRPVMVKVSE